MYRTAVDGATIAELRDSLAIAPHSFRPGVFRIEMATLHIVTQNFRRNALL